MMPLQATPARARAPAAFRAAAAAAGSREVPPRRDCWPPTESHNKNNNTGFCVWAARAPPTPGKGETGTATGRSSSIGTEGAMLFLHSG
mmetsp:Transcript_34197/g.72817  ORF Transcript_34197/g.72817 Transcript_34197/m.72817 type:complete len:89 (+) Transcript_34197:470-736(+)